MSQLIAALFETRARAEEALSALIGAGVASERVEIVGGGEEGDAATMAAANELATGRDVSADLTRLRLPEEDASAFAAGCSGGGAVLAARIEGDEVDEAIRVIETFEPIDLDSRTEAMLASADQPAAAADGGAPLAAGMSAGGMGGQSNTGALPGMGALTDGSDGLGSADLRTDEAGLADMGLSATPTGAGRAEDRAGAPGTIELGAPGDAQLATERSPSAEQSAGMGLGAKPDLFRRENRVGRVRFYVAR